MNKICHICESRNLKKLSLCKKINFVLSNNSSTSLKKELYYCYNCTNVVCSIDKKIITNLNKIYKSYNLNNLSFKNDLNLFSKNKVTKRSEIIVDQILHFKTKKHEKHLDIGSGSGALLYALSKKTNLKLNAFDLSDENHSNINKIKNFEKFYFSDLKNIDEKFDIITLSHVLEHFINPVLYLKKILALLNENGLLFIQVPNSLEKPFDFIVYDHMSNFSLNGLKFIYNNIDVKLIKISKSLISNELVCILRKHTSKSSKKQININLLSHFKKNISFINNYVKFIKNKIQDKKIIIYGAGNSGVFTASNIKNWDGFFVDDDNEKQNFLFLGKKVFKSDILKKKDLIFLPFKYEDSLRIINSKKKLNKFNFLYFNE